MSFRYVLFKLGTVSRKHQISPKSEIIIELQNLYMARKEEKRRITVEKAYDILLDTVIKCDWQQKMTPSFPKIKSFFSKTPAKMEDTIQGVSDEITNDDMEQMYIDDAKEREEEIEDLSL